MPTVPNRLYAGWSPEGVDIKIIEAEMPGGGGLAGALLAVNNLSDLTDVVAARNNLGLGGSALAPSGTYLERLSNLSDLGNVATARDNLGLGNTGVVAGSYTSTNLTVDALGRITAAANGSSGGSSLTATQIGYGDGSNLLTGNANFTYTVINSAINSTVAFAGISGITWENQSNSALASTHFTLTSDSGAVNFLKRSTAFTTDGLIVANQATVLNATGGFLFSNTLATDFLWATGGKAAVNEVMRILGASPGTVSFGVAGTSIGSLRLYNATSGSGTIVPPTGALGTLTWTMPAASGTVALTSDLSGFATLGANSFTGTQTVINASANAAQLILGGTAFANPQPTENLNLVEFINNDTTSINFRMSTYGTAPPVTSQNAMHFFRARGTLASPTAVQNGDILFGFGGRGWDGSKCSVSQVSIHFNVTENWTTTANGTNMVFGATANGSVNRANIITIDSLGLTIETGLALQIKGSSSGTAILKTAAAAGTPTITLPTVTSTLAILGANTFTAAQISTSNPDSGYFGFKSENTSTGTAGYSGILVSNSANFVGMFKRSTGFTTVGLVVANTSQILDSSGQMLISTNGNSPIIFSTNGTAAANETVRFDPTTGVTIKSGVALRLGNAATTGLTAGVLAATTNASIVITDSAGTAYRIPCIV